MLLDSSYSAKFRAARRANHLNNYSAATFLRRFSPQADRILGGLGFIHAPDRGPGLAVIRDAAGMPPGLWLQITLVVTVRAVAGLRIDRGLRGGLTEIRVHTARRAVQNRGPGRWRRVRVRGLLRARDPAD